MDLVTCCEIGDLETFRRLINENPDGLKTCGDLCIEYASKNGHLDIVRELLMHGVDPNSRNYEEQTPLDRACYYGHLDIVKELLRAGVDVNMTDDIGWTPLHGATINGYFDIVRELLKYNANPNKQTCDGSTVLHHAIDSKNLTLIQELIPHCDLALKNIDACNDGDHRVNLIMETIRCI
jgi:ankyrin repeat protein